MSHDTTAHEAHAPMQELSLEDLDDLPYAGVALAQDTWGAARVSRDASLGWSLFSPLPPSLAR